jgi:hypothetical protein
VGHIVGLGIAQNSGTVRERGAGKCEGLAHRTGQGDRGAAGQSVGPGKLDWAVEQWSSALG